MNLKKIGMITIGQSPRTDVVPEIKGILGSEIDILEAGALDGLSLEEVKRFSPGKGDYVLCTRMSDGTEVVIAKKFILPRMQRCIDLLTRKGAGIVLLLCTGKFPEFSSKRLLIEPQKILDNFILAFDGKGQRIGLMIPLRDQMGQAEKKYAKMKGQTIMQAASPYGRRDEVALAAKALKKANPHVIVMHCMGYTQAMKDQVREMTGKPVILARSLVGRTLKELLS
ncbi:MAG: AroM family protein [Deltaproteobacteria bacterium]|nr:MAG: AroM family protein [Deltaproteobacteria bacterium]